LLNAAPVEDQGSSYSRMPATVVLSKVPDAAVD
jgi:hypothetical protein